MSLVRIGPGNKGFNYGSDPDEDVCLRNCLCRGLSSLSVFWFMIRVRENNFIFLFGETLKNMSLPRTLPAFS